MSGKTPDRPAIEQIPGILDLPRHLIRGFGERYGNIVSYLRQGAVDIGKRQGHVEEGKSVLHAFQPKVPDEAVVGILLSRVGVEQGLADVREKLPEGDIRVNVVHNGQDVEPLPLSTLRTPGNNPGAPGIFVEAYLQRRHENGVVQKVAAARNLIQPLKEFPAEVQINGFLFFPVIRGPLVVEPEV